jgi:hypothetical protein
MKTRIWSCLSALSLVLLLGCSKKEEPPPAPAQDSAAQAPIIPADHKPSAAVPLDLDQVPVAEQFEKEVEAEVTPANFEQQLDALEKELKTK